MARGRGLASAIWLYLIILFINVGVFVAALVATDDYQVGVALGMIAATLIDALVIGGWMIGSWSRIRDALGAPFPILWSFAAVGMGCFTVPIAMLLSLPIEYLTDFAEEPDIIAPLLDAGFDWRFVVLIIAVCAGVFEELAFRGIIFGALRSVLHEREVILVTALMFMVLHLDPTDFPYLLFLGLVLGVVRSKSKSLYPCMILHFTHNLIFVLLYFLSDGGSE